MDFKLQSGLTSQTVGNLENPLRLIRAALSFPMMYERELAQQIVAYLRNHAFSGDTLEGVSRWWLKQQRINECVNEVHHALVRLGNEGLIYERTTPDGRTVFFANSRFEAVENAGFEEGNIH